VPHQNNAKVMCF